MSWPFEFSTIRLAQPYQGFELLKVGSKLRNKLSGEPSILIYYYGYLSKHVASNTVYVINATDLDYHGSEEGEKKDGSDEPPTQHIDVNPSKNWDIKV